MKEKKMSVYISCFKEAAKNRGFRIGQIKSTYHVSRVEMDSAPVESCAALASI